MKLLLIGVILSGFFLSGCSSNKLATTEIEHAAQKRALATNVTPEQAVAETRELISQAETDKLDYFTPMHFKNVQEVFESIEKIQQSNEVKNKDIAVITEAFKAQELLKKAYLAKAVIDNTLADVFSHQAILLAIGSKEQYPKTYGDIVEELNLLFKLIENNKVEQARKDKKNVLADMVELEINTLVKLYVLPAKIILEKADDKDADDYAEKTYEQAELSIERAVAFIKNYYRQHEDAKKFGHEAVIAAKRALNIGQLSSEMVRLSENDAEKKALEFEKILALIIKGMKAEDLEGLTLREQAEALANIGELQLKRLKTLENNVSSEASESPDTSKSTNTNEVIDDAGVIDDAEVNDDTEVNDDAEVIDDTEVNEASRRSNSADVNNTIDNNEELSEPL
jgi:hypothetical protein